MNDVLLNRRREMMQKKKGHNLPAPLKEVEYLWNNASGNNNGYVRLDVPTNNIGGIYIKFQMMGNGPYNRYDLHVLYGTNRQQVIRLGCSYDNSSINMPSMGVITLDDRDAINEIEFMYGEPFYINGISVAQTAIFDNTSTNNLPPYLFACNDGGVGYYYSDVKIYEFKIFDKQKNLIRHLIPCYADYNTLRHFYMYDIVNGVVYEGSGSFTVG